ncbi:MAG: hypothetical protein ABIQ88_11760 [Chitinophagaceae bacterium]
MKKIIFFNILFFFVLLFILMIAALGMGYASNNRFGTDAGILYVLIIVVHLFLNYFIMHRQAQFSLKKIGYASAIILAAYLLILFH